MSYTRTNWENSPSMATPLSASNLNNLESGVAAAHALLDGPLVADAADAAVAAAVGSRCVSLDANGVPYFDPVAGTHFLLRGADGIPYIQPTIAPALTRGAGGFIEIA